MATVQKYRHLGAYGICLREGQLLVIRKKRGAYNNRYDLPGGRVENNESIFVTLRREFLEETGCQALDVRHLGVWDCQLPWEEQGYDPMLMHHIAMLFRVSVEVEPDGGDRSHDSQGALWVSLGELSEENGSPLVMAAVEYAKTGSLPLETKVYEQWTVKE